MYLNPSHFVCAGRGSVGLPATPFAQEIAASEEVLSSHFSVLNRFALTENLELSLLRNGNFSCRFHQRTQLAGGDPKRSSGKAVNISGVDAHDFAVHV
jgi:hypothetical protein